MASDYITCGGHDHIGVMSAAPFPLDDQGLKQLGSADDPILGTIGGVVLNSVRVEQLP